MKVKTKFLKITPTEKTVFNPPSNYEFKLVDGVKIETLESYLKRGGSIEFIGTFSSEDHPTNSPSTGLLAPILRKAS